MPSYDPSDPRSFYNYIYGSGSQPTVPDIPTASKVTAGVQPGTQAAVDAVNRLNIAGQTAANNARIPNATGLEAASSAMIADQLAGKIPADVMRMLARTSAERGVGMGLGINSPNVDLGYFRDVVGNSLAMQKLGQENLSAALARNPSAQVVNAKDFTLTPEQAATINNQANEINIRGILGQGGLGVDVWKAAIDDATKRLAIEKGQYGQIPWWAANNPNNTSAGKTWVSWGNGEGYWR